MTVRISSRPARPADNVAAVGQINSRRAHAMQTARDRAAVIQRAYPRRGLNPVTVRGDNPAAVVKPGNRLRPHRRLRRRRTRVILNQTGVGQLADGDIFIVQAIIAAPYRATVGHISGSTSARQGNTGPVGAANQGPGLIAQALNKPHPDAIRAARNLTGDACPCPRRGNRVGQAGKRRSAVRATDAPARCRGDVAGVGQAVARAADVNRPIGGIGGGDVAAVGNGVVAPRLNASAGVGTDTAIVVIDNAVAVPGDNAPGASAGDVNGAVVGDAAAVSGLNAIRICGAGSNAAVVDDRVISGAGFDLDTRIS